MSEQITHLIIFIVSIGAISALIFTGHGTPNLETVLISIVGASGVGVIVKSTALKGDKNGAN